MNPDQAKVDLEHLDRDVEMFARMREIELSDEMRRILRDAMLWAFEEAAAEAVMAAAPEHEDRRWNAAERAVYAAMTAFAEVQRAWIDRCREALGLPERLGKRFEDQMALAKPKP